MLGEEFKTWPANLLSNVIVVIIRMHITNLGYLKDRPLCFLEFLDSSMEESNRMLVRLDIVAIIPETNN